MKTPRLAAFLTAMTIFVPLLIPTLTVQAQSVAAFAAAPCMFDLPRRAVDGADVNCGYVTVPEVHANPTGPQIKMAVAVFKSPTKTPSTDAIMYIEGGPGGAVNDTVASFYNVFSRDFVRDRDFIFFDQRGVGKSQPALNCPEVAASWRTDDTANLSFGMHYEHRIAAALRCKDRLVSAGVNLSAYDSAEGAADINDIRAALGYTALDLIGVSYGTRVALTALRDNPKIVRAAVLDSVVPLEATIFEDSSKDFDDVLNAYFQACTRSVKCSAAYPTLRADFADLYVKLNANPIAVPRTDATTGEAYSRLISGDVLVVEAHSFLYSYGGFIDLADNIESVKNYVANPTQLRPRKVTTDESDDLGAYWSVNCAEEVPFNNYDRALANAQKVSFELREWAVEQVKAAYAICAQWPVKQLGAVETSPVVSSVPALVMTSADDVATPARYGRAVALSLNKSFLVTAPAVGHSVIFNGGDCGVTIAFAFIVTPTKRPSTSCVSDL